MRKTAKSKLLDLFSLQAVDSIPTDYVSVVDMGLIWRLATPTPLDYEAREMVKTTAGVITLRKFVL